ncbi:MAG: hypothetical protein EBR88_00160 [Betaproteobacteria bacterium]|nr:hypothetical protein [Betaproteobacteria bacterium]
MPHLPSVLESYLASRTLDHDYAANLARVARKCQELNSQAVNLYLRKRLTEVSPKTVANERNMILILWRHAYDSALIDVYPRQIVKIKVPAKPVRAWTVQQCSAAVKHARQRRGQKTRTGADVGCLLECWLRLGYATGARWSDLWSMGRAHLDGSVLRYTQAKTGNAVVAVLPDQCLKLCDEMLAASPDGRILGWVFHKRRAMRMMKQHLAACGLSGTSKWLRRSAATHIEQRSPGKARLFLGHKTPTMVRHYLDMGQLLTDVPQPPLLE